MKNCVYIATSLDGFIARKDGNIDWLLEIENPSNDDYGYNEFISGIDAIVMGRNSYEKVLTFDHWPYVKKVFVLSSTLKEISRDLKEKVTLLSMKPKELLENLLKNGYKNLYVDGGKLIQSFLNEDLIDELIITRIPVLIGEGIPLFGYLKNDLKFIHIKTDVYPNGLVKSHYRRKRN